MRSKVAFVFALIFACSSANALGAEAISGRTSSLPSIGDVLVSESGANELTLRAINSVKGSYVFSLEASNSTGHTGFIDRIEAKPGELVTTFIGPRCSIDATAWYARAGLVVEIVQRGDECPGLGLGVRVGGIYFPKVKNPPTRAGAFEHSSIAYCSAMHIKCLAGGLHRARPLENGSTLEPLFVLHQLERAQFAGQATCQTLTWSNGLTQIWFGSPEFRAYAVVSASCEVLPNTLKYERKAIID